MRTPEQDAETYYRQEADSLRKRVERMNNEMLRRLQGFEVYRRALGAIHEIPGPEDSYKGYRAAWNKAREIAAKAFEELP